MVYAETSQGSGGSQLLTSSSSSRALTDGIRSYFEVQEVRLGPSLTKNSNEKRHGRYIVSSSISALLSTDVWW